MSTNSPSRMDDDELSTEEMHRYALRWYWHRFVLSFWAAHLFALPLAWVRTR